MSARSFLRCALAFGGLPLAAPGLLAGDALAADAASPGACGAPATPIHVIQGAGASSSLAGRDGVVVEGVVVGDFRGLPDGLGGFFLQEEDVDADADPETSEGLFVFGDGAGADVRVGDTVRVRGEVREFFGLTELGRIEALRRCPSRGVASATPVRLPVEGARAWERWEGMRVRIAQPLTVSDTYDLGRYGELTLAAGGRLWQPTQRAQPGDAARAWAARNARHRILLDDGSDAWRPDPPPYLATARGDALRVGDRIDALEGVLDFAFGDFRLQPTAPVSITAEAPRSVRPPPVAGNLRVAAWNVENFFNGDGAGGGFPTRGAAGPDEAARQRAKLVAVLAALDADVLALIELENDGTGPGSAARELADALAEATAAPWAIVDPGAAVAPRHAIAVGLLYRPDRIEPVGIPAWLGAGEQPVLDAAFDGGRNRPSLARSFRHLASGGRVTVAVSHLKSKGSPCAGDPDTGDGQGECSETRRRAAEALAAWLAGDPTGAGDAPVLIVGDLNAYPNEDALIALADAGLVDLLAWFVGPDAYSYVFDGAAGRLDHALASPDLLPHVGGAALWHVSADAPPLLDYRAENPPELYAPDPLRASDHDPVLVGLFPDAGRGCGRAHAGGPRGPKAPGRPATCSRPPVPESRRCPPETTRGGPGVQDRGRRLPATRRIGAREAVRRRVAHSLLCGSACDRVSFARIPAWVRTTSRFTKSIGFARSGTSTPVSSRWGTKPDSTPSWRRPCPSSSR